MIIREKIKMLEQSLETEQFRRRQLESLNESLHSQLMEIQKQLSSGEALPIPEGFTLIETDYFNQLISERDHLSSQHWEQQQQLSKFHNNNKKSNRIPRVDKTKSEIHTQNFQRRELSMTPQKGTKSHCRFPSIERPLCSPIKAPFVEKNIGDTCDNVPERCEEDILKIFMKKKTTNPNPSLMNLDRLNDHSDEQHFSM